ncbi:MAG: flagellar biosynthesis protein FlgD [Deltaproteobacteria bacterium]|nr:flagellar biosynthesis protein FlgD [Deltaproteobacteria bacterium]
MVSSVGVYGSTTGLNRTGAQEAMGKDAFLKLLVTQLQNQDPLNPTDNTEFVAQLAQFSSLEGIQNLNSTMTGMAGSLGSLSDMGSAGLIGRMVKAEAEGFEHAAGQEHGIGFELGSASNSTQLTISNEYGLAVRSIDLGPLPAGEHEIVWDGTDGSGSPLPTGKYAFSVNAKGSNGSAIGAAKYLLGFVTGVNLADAGGASLYVNGTPVKKESIKEIY